MIDRDASEARSDRILARAEALARKEAGDSARAQVIIDAFVRKALAAGLPTRRLKARAYTGDARYRTEIEGWYVRKDCSVGIDPQGRYYVLLTPASLAARVKGVELQPSAPPLYLGYGALDGESISLEDLLKRRLAAGTGFPS